MGTVPCAEKQLVMEQLVMEQLGAECSQGTCEECAQAASNHLRKGQLVEPQRLHRETECTELCAVRPQHRR